jgi:sarcosine/dimethylglycine N-methyltransferase
MSDDVVDKAEAYYDSSDADEFYFRVWGGEDIHIGLYEEGETDIFEASRRTVATICEKLDHLPRGTRMLDIGAGYGGSARYLAREHGHRVTCLNISKVQNRRNREMNAEQGLDELIDVFDGNFEDLPFEDDAFDLVWCQDSILHSGNRFKVFQEVDRVLRPGGEFIFTDPMQKQNADPEALKPVLARIHLSSMGSVEEYRGFAEKLGWRELEVDLHTEQLVRHYSAVLANLERREDELKSILSREYIDNMMTGLRHWIEAGKSGVLAWGILHFKKGA